MDFVYLIRAQIEYSRCDYKRRCLEFWFVVKTSGLNQ